MASELKWHNVDLTALSKEEQGLWSKMKETYKVYIDLRSKFEGMVDPFVRKTLDASQSEEVKFGYRFGQLSVALAPVTIRKGKNVLTLKR